MMMYPFGHLEPGIIDHPPGKTIQEKQQPADNGLAIKKGWSTKNNVNAHRRPKNSDKRPLALSRYPG